MAEEEKFGKESEKEHSDIQLSITEKDQDQVVFLSYIKL